MNFGPGALLFLNGLRTTGEGIRQRVRERAQEMRQSITVSNKKASVVLYQWVLNNFQGEGELAGGWLPLSEATVKWKQERGYSRMLQNTGALRASFLPYSDDNIALVGSPLWYAEQHDEGSGRVPQRKLLPTAEQAQEMVMPIYGREMKIVTGKPL